MTVLDAPVGGLDTHRRSARTRGGRVDTERANRSRSAQRAIDRRHKRIGARSGEETGAGGHTAATAPTSARSGLRARFRRMPFVVPVLAILVLGLALSLWLSTKAAQDSYQLSVIRKQNQALVDHRDSLKRTYESGDSAPELSDKASRLGLIPAHDPARMIVGPDGRSHIVGDPAPATGKPAQPLNPDSHPDPTTRIDTSKVDDSVGLPGAAGQSQQAPSTAPASPAAPSPNPSTGTDGTHPSANPLPVAGAPAGAADQRNAPAPNVAPAAPQASPPQNPAPQNPAPRRPAQQSPARPSAGNPPVANSTNRP